MQRRTPTPEERLRVGRLSKLYLPQID
jgi:hypothetical protein